jgi:hypothetical protein
LKVVRSLKKNKWTARTCSFQAGK